MSLFNAGPLAELSDVSVFLELSRMRRILVATDFSARADRAIRRGALMARQFDCDLVVAHVVDDDQAESLIQVERREAQNLLEKLSLGLRKSDGLRCEAELALGEPFEQIPALAQTLEADLIILGPYRRDRLKNIFVGATAERIIRSSATPVLMANGLPAAPYERVLLATDFSQNAERAISTTMSLGLLGGAQVSAIHAYLAAADSLMARTAANADHRKDYLLKEAATALAKLKELATATGLDLTDLLVEHIELSAAETIRGAASRIRAELIVVGAQGRTALSQAWLGSVSQDLLRFAEVDILVIPTPR
ncbi:MAG: universal stress protein [Phenylobacterium sp.]|nr:universal stress protein [Phenylobacterium sp.]